MSNWFVKEHDFPEEALGTMLVGNGGFSLRSKKLLTLLSGMSESNEISEYHPEDVVVCVRLRKELESRGIVFAPEDVAGQFSFESLDDQNNYKWTDQFGFHGLKWTDISKWLDKHPELDIDNTLNRDIKK